MPTASNSPHQAHLRRKFSQSPTSRANGQTEKKATPAWRACGKKKAVKTSLSVCVSLRFASGCEHHEPRVHRSFIWDAPGARGRKSLTQLEKNYTPLSLAFLRTYPIRRVDCGKIKRPGYGWQFIPRFWRLVVVDDDVEVVVGRVTPCGRNDCALRRTLNV